MSLSIVSNSTVVAMAFRHVTWRTAAKSTETIESQNQSRLGEVTPSRAISTGIDCVWTLSGTTVGGGNLHTAQDKGHSQQLSSAHTQVRVPALPLSTQHSHGFALAWSGSVRLARCCCFCWFEKRAKECHRDSRPTLLNFRKTT